MGVPNPDFHSSADPDPNPAAKNNADPDPQPWRYNVVLSTGSSAPTVACICPQTVSAVQLYDTHLLTFIPLFSLILLF